MVAGLGHLPVADVGVIAGFGHLPVADLDVVARLGHLPVADVGVVAGLGVEEALKTKALINTKYQNKTCHSNITTINEIYMFLIKIISLFFQAKFNTPSY